MSVNSMPENNKNELQQKIINNVVNRIFSGISERVKKLKKAGIVNYKNIDNFSLIYKIIKNEPDKKKNKYLLTPQLAEQIVENTKNQYDSYELVWGKDSKSDLFHYLFVEGIKYLSLNQRGDEVVDTALKDDFAFAVAVGQDPNCVINSNRKYSNLKQEATNRLYKILQEPFYQLHQDFFKNKITTKIDKELRLFYLKFQKLIEAYNSDRQYRGIQIENLAKSITQTLPLVFSDNLEDILSLDKVKILNFENNDVNNNALNISDSKEKINKTANELLELLIKEQKQEESNPYYYSNTSAMLKYRLLKKIR